jgi:hypothetical protein
MSVSPVNVIYMDSSIVLGVGAPRPDPAGRHLIEVVVTAPREDGGEPLVLRVLPPEVLGCWAADRVSASVAVLTARASSAVPTAEALLSELSGAAGAVVTVRVV